MKVINPFQVYSWKFKSLFVLVLSISLSMWGSIGLDLIGFHIPLVRQLIGIVYILFIPGILILRFLDIHKIDDIEALLYIVGLSVAFIMFTGFFINHFSLYLGITKPISVIPLVVTISFIFLLLSALCYFNDKDHYNYDYIPTKNILSTKPLLLFFIPIFVIYGTYLVNIYHINVLIVVFILLISLIFLSHNFLIVIPLNLFPLTLFTISISLLFHNSLISTYIWGCDIQHEYYLANLVISNLHWDPNLSQNTNAMLSIVMLFPIISNLCNIDLVWTFKIISPLLFSLLPLGLYKIFERQTSKEIAFLSCIFFISCFSFYTEMLSLARQQIAELFFVLLILLMTNHIIEDLKKVILAIVFSFSIIVSHYAFSYLFIMSLLFSLILFKFITVIDEKSIISVKVESNKNISLEKLVSPTFILLFMVFALSWYMYISRGSAFSVIVRIGDSIFNSLFTDFLNPEKAQGAQILTSKASSYMRDITKYLHILSIFFISIGVLKLVVKRKSTQFNNGYIAFSFSYFIICVLGIVVPYFAVQLNTSRLYYISLLVLAPFFSIGSLSLFNIIIHHKLDAFWINLFTKQTFKVLSIFLAIFFLFNSGLLYEIKGEESSSVSLNNSHYPFIYNEGEVSAVSWINLYRNQVSTIYADVGGGNLLTSVTSNYSILPFITKNIYLPKNNYLLITTLNTKYNQIYVRNSLTQLEYIDIKYLFESNKINNIYDSGYGKVGFV